MEIKEKYSTKFEVPSIIKKYDGSKILLFSRTLEADVPVVAGLCGRRDFFMKELRCGSEEDLFNSIIYAINNPSKPALVEEAPVKEVLEKPRLKSLPILTHYERDAGPYITAGVVIARSMSKDFQNASIHRLLVLDDDHLAIRIVPRHLYALLNEAEREGRALPVAIAIGLHPLIMLAASSGPKLGVDELEVANTLLRGKLKLTKCENENILVPAEAELVLEGRILPNEEVEEGPFVDVTGTYDIVRKQPVVEIVGVMRRKDYIYQALLPAGSEHRLLMGLPREARIWDSVSKVVPRVKSVRLTSGGCGWFHAVVSIDKQAEGDGKNAIMAAFAAHPSLKHVVVVDSDINVDDPNDIEWAIATRMQGNEDLIVISNCRGSSLDPSADQERLITSKVGVDATMPLSKPREKFERAVIPCKFDLPAGSPEHVSDAR